MDTFQAGEITLEKVRECVWEISQEGGMHVPARVFASEALLEEIAEDKTLEQLKNSAQLPGITKYAICMPDGHQGYGFPVGGVGAMDAEHGCISPGAIGYDINCLTGDAEVLLEFDRRREIAALKTDFEDERAIVAAEGGTAAEMRLFTESRARVYAVETETGDEIVATADHPFLTPTGMVELRNLEAGDTIQVSPFRGMPDAEPKEFTVLTGEDVPQENPQLRRALSERDLLPLKSTDDAFQRFLKLVGYHTGDGSFSNAGHSWFAGDPEDLEAIREDIAATGFTPSPISSREREHGIKGNEFETTEYSVCTSSEAFQLVMQQLGAPAGNKVESDFTTPWYFDRLTAWQQRLYLAGYFGAVMNAPSAKHDEDLYRANISQNRREEHAEAGEQFMREIADALAEFGIETNSIEQFETDSGGSRETTGFRLGVKNDSHNLIRFYSLVGFEYNQRKQALAAKATQYLRVKAATLDPREQIADDAKAMADGGYQPAGMKATFDLNDRSIERDIWSGRTGRARLPADFPGFDEFCERVHVDENGTVETEIIGIEERGQASVYDIGVVHDAHNFLANGFVVSNCGVRMMKTNMLYDDLRGREEELVDSLFTNIPSGLGGGGVVETDKRTLEDILERGVEWAVDNGWGVDADLAHCEDEGSRPEADADAVSQRAKDRGKNQLGSLGSGNHFLEVQRVTDVFRDDVADAFGLWEDQIVVLIHCGSRGLGHQVCTDYLRKIEQQHADLLAELPDKELAAAPAGSELAEQYYDAMGAAINFAWVNRQLVMHRTRQVFERVFQRPWEDLGMELLYDVAHNIGKKETHEVDGDQRELYVHRKGATRAFPAGRPELPPAYRDVGQPVIIPGSMGTGSYVLRGGERSLELSFGSTAHGAGRLMSRTQAKNTYWGEDVQDELEADHQVYVRAQSGATVAEEAPGVYKNVDEVVRVSDALGIGDTVARTFPICNIKG